MGDKFKIIDQIAPHFPKNIETFFEPFTGGGTVFLNVSAKKYLLNDIDYYLIELHKFLQQQSSNPSVFYQELETLVLQHGLSRSYLEDIIPQDLKQQFKKTYYAEFNKNAYVNLRTAFNQDKENMSALYLLLIYGFNRMLRFNASGNFNLPVGNVDLNKNVLTALTNYFDFVKNRDLTFSNMDYTEFLSHHTFRQNDFIYLDPPYLISASEYNKYWNVEEEEKLLSCLDELSNQKIKWAISNMVSSNTKSNFLFASWMKKYNVIDIKSNYISFNDNSIKSIKEVLITNY